MGQHGPSVVTPPTSGGSSGLLSQAVPLPSPLPPTLAAAAAGDVMGRGAGMGHFGLALPFYTHFTSPIRRRAGAHVFACAANFLPVLVSF